MKKHCSSCFQEKEIEEFYDRAGGKYGKHAQCKICMRHAQALWVISHPEERKESQRRSDQKRRDKIKDFIEVQKEFKLKYGNEQAFNKYKYECQKNIKLQARLYLNTAVQLGYIIKPEICEICSEPRSTIEGHHDDYSKPLDVKWCCHKCHMKNYHRKKQDEIDNLINASN